MPNWDEASHKKVKDALLVLATTLPSFRGSFGAKGEVNPIHHLIGAAAGWGGNPDKDAIYLGVTPKNNDGSGVYKLDREECAGRGFWSISVYNAQGYFEKNPVQCLFGQQHHREEESGRLGDGAVRRLRRQDRQLPADHQGLELHRAALSAEAGNPERQMEIPGGAAGGVEYQLSARPTDRRTLKRRSGCGNERSMWLTHRDIV